MIYTKLPDLTEQGSLRKTLFSDKIREVERERRGDRLQSEVESQAEKNKQRDTETERQTKGLQTGGTKKD